LDSDAEIDTLLLFAILEHRVTSSFNQQGLEIASLQADPLNHANSKQRLIASVEGLIHYISHTLNGNYLIAIADHFSRLQWQQGLVDILPLIKN
jgi:hypothetical protein